jgi:hypothetical protein
MSFHTYKVGSVTLLRPLEVVQHFECAAWHQKILVQPGTHDLFCSVSWGMDSIHGGSFWARVEGVVTSADFTSRLGAHHGGNEHGERLIGTTQPGTVQAAMAYGMVGEEPGVLTTSQNLVVTLDMAVLERHEWLPERWNLMGPEPKMMFRYTVRKSAVPEPARRHG